MYLLKSYIKTKDCRQPSILLIPREKATHHTKQEHSAAHTAPPVRQIRQTMTEPVQVDTNTQRGYKHAQQEQGNGYILNVHRPAPRFGGDLRGFPQPLTDGIAAF